MIFPLHEWEPLGDLSSGIMALLQVRLRLSLCGDDNRIRVTLFQTTCLPLPSCWALIDIALKNPNSLWICFCSRSTVLQAQPRGCGFAGALRVNCMGPWKIPLAETPFNGV